MRQWREVDHTLSGAEITNEWSYTFSPHAVLDRENFTCTFAVISWETDWPFEGSIISYKVVARTTQRAQFISILVDFSSNAV
jgi:hypothetical protein